MYAGDPRPFGLPVEAGHQSEGRHWRRVVL